MHAVLSFYGLLIWGPVATWYPFAHWTHDANIIAPNSLTTLLAHKLINGWRALGVILMFINEVCSFSKCSYHTNSLLKTKKFCTYLYIQHKREGAHGGGDQGEGAHGGGDQGEGAHGGGDQGAHGGGDQGDVAHMVWLNLEYLNV